MRPRISLPLNDSDNIVSNKIYHYETGEHSLSTRSIFIGVCVSGIFMFHTPFICVFVWLCVINLYWDTENKNIQQIGSTHTHTHGERVRATTPCNNSNNHNEGNLFEIQSKTLENHTHKVILILLQRNNICNPNNHISTTWRAHTHTPPSRMGNKRGRKRWIYERSNDIRAHIKSNRTDKRKTKYS